MSSKRRHTLRQSFGFAAEGIRHVLRTQRNARLHFAIAVAVIGLGSWLRLDAWSWAILALTIGIMFVAEFVNTVVEAIVDLASPEYHPLAKVAKDVAAGAVLVMAIVAVTVGLLLLGPPLWDRAKRGLEGESRIQKIESRMAMCRIHHENGEL